MLARNSNSPRMLSGQNIHTTAIPVKPLALSYIDHRLTDRIPAFADFPMHYDLDRQQYVPNGQVIAPQAFSIQPRPDMKESKPLEFWHDMFGKAMEQLKSKTKEPKGQAGSA